MLGFLSSIAAPVIGGLFGMSGQKKANETNVALARDQMAFSADQAQKQMDFQERMSNTSYQRAVTDLKSAGLNPMLAYTQGGSSTPGGASGSSAPARVESVAGAGVASAQQAVGTMQGVEAVRQTRAQTQLLEAQADRVRAETQSQEAYSARFAQEVQQMLESASLSKEQRLKLAEQFPQWEVERKLKELDLQFGKATFESDVQRRKSEAQLVTSETARAKAEEEFYKGLGEKYPYLRALIDVLRGGVSVRSILGGDRAIVNKSIHLPPRK